MLSTDGLPVQIVKDRYDAGPASLIDIAIPAAFHVDGNAEGIALTFALMELMGIEPTTSGLQNRRSPS